MEPHRLAGFAGKSATGLSRSANNRFAGQRKNAKLQEGQVRTGQPLVLLKLCFALNVVRLARFLLPAQAQVVTATIQVRVYDPSGPAISHATVTAVNPATGLTRSTTASVTGDYQFTLLPSGDYTITAEKSGFQKAAKKIHLDIGTAGNLDFTLPVGQVTEQVTVQDVGEVAEPMRTMVSSVIDEQKIQNLPVNGRQFIDFALLAPGVTIGDTTSGSTDVIIEPVTKLSFAGQNIHYNFVAIDGADNMSTASGIQKTTPSQEAVQEFRVVNRDRKSTRLNSSHVATSYAVFCLKKKSGGPRSRPRRSCPAGTASLARSRPIPRPTVPQLQLGRLVCGHGRAKASLFVRRHGRFQT